MKQEEGSIKIKKKTIRKLKALKKSMDLPTYDEVIKEIIYVHKKR